MDISHFLETTSRSVRNDSRDGTPVKILEISRAYPTTDAELWDMLTKADRIPKWFLPISGDLHVGGRYQFEGNAGGEVLECIPPRRIAITWEMFGQISWVDLTIAPTEGGISLTLLHTAAVPDEMWNQYGPGAVGIGWESGFIGLQKHLETGEATDPAKGQAWMASPEGREFIEGSSQAWVNASIESGTDPDQAKEAGTTCEKAYKGEA